MAWLKINYHSDSAHGWFEVDIAELDALGIADQITPYSYHHGTRAFLEEDCDATTYFKALERTGITYEIVDSYVGGEHPIRGYQRFGA